ncbi:formin-like protein 3 [Schistocerca americana]|uniref:formin-like protein 3 n=1 Tax=Schistocerca americana TaxID=7009 RepID=UPI001F502D64|nr:formin-like protein 3 [Schistocerca americana]
MINERAAGPTRAWPSNCASPRSPPGLHPRRLRSTPLAHRSPPPPTQPPPRATTGADTAADGKVGDLCARTPPQPAPGSLIAPVRQHRRSSITPPTHPLPNPPPRCQHVPQPLPTAICGGCAAAGRPSEAAPPLGGRLCVAATLVGGVRCLTAKKER